MAVFVINDSIDATLNIFIDTYLIKIGGDEGNSIAGSCHLDEATEHSVPHWSVLIHAVEKVTQPIKPQNKQDRHLS